LNRDAPESKNSLPEEVLAEAKAKLARLTMQRQVNKLQEEVQHLLLQQMLPAPKCQGVAEGDPQEERA
jgi:hypothetical protein